MTKVAIIGASGMAGREIYQAASKQADLQVTGIVRNQAKAEKVPGQSAQLIVKDVFKMTNEELGRFDAIVDSFGTDPDHANQQIELAKKLVGAARQNHLRLLFVLGAGSLHTGADRHYVADDLAKAPKAENFINTPLKQLKELQYLRTVKDVDWVGFSPSVLFVPGPASKHYAIGGDDLLFNQAGKSQVTAGTMGEVIAQELEKPAHHYQRLTVVDA